MRRSCSCLSCADWRFNTNRADGTRAMSQSRQHRRSWTPALLATCSYLTALARCGTISALDRVNRKKSLLVGDGGGYQIGKGTLSGMQYVKRGPIKASVPIDGAGQGGTR